MSVRDVRVRLRAEVADFNRQIAQSAEVVDKASAQFDRSGQRIETSAGRMVRSAEVNREAWTTTGSAFLAVGAAITGVGIAAARTGVQYNTLRQTSTAALTTMLGTATAAADQMDRLDDFATNSPFARQVFITAQQQMLGFGVAAQDVIPALDAIQNAVAAMGGSNDQIAALSEILARIRSEGRLSGDALQRLGYYGIDAAAIIGDQMGLTSAEIRDMARKPGGIPAEQIWDPLVEGLSQKFGGAADNVKETYEGAIDRVKAAWRDLGAELATPLVDPEGGGMLVDLANEAADAMRAFQALPEPLKATIVGLVGTAGAAALAAGGFLLLGPRLLSLVIDMDRLGIMSTQTSLKLMRSFAKGGLVVGAVVAGVAAMTAAVEAYDRANNQAPRGIQTTTSALLDMVEAGGRLEGVFNFSESVGDAGALSGDINSLADAAARISDPTFLNRISDVGGSIRGLFGSGETARTQSIEQIDTIGQSLAQLVQSGNAERAAAQFEILAAEWQAGGGTLAEFRDLMPAYSEALAAVDNEQRLAADSGERLAAVQEGLANAEEMVTESLEKSAEARKIYTDAINEWRSELSASFRDFVNNTDAFNSAVQKSIEGAQAQADATNAWRQAQDDGIDRGTAKWEDYYDGISVSAAAFIDQLQEQIDAQDKWASNIGSLQERIGEQFSGRDFTVAVAELEALANQGPASAGVVQTLAGATDKELAEIVELWNKGGSDAAGEFVSSFEEFANPFVDLRLNMESADEDLARWEAQRKAYVDVELQISEPSGGFLGGLANWRERATAYGVDGLANGGPITGRGTSTSDSIPIMASNGEFMQSAPAHSFWGTRAMQSMNNRDVNGLWQALSARGFKDGGSIGAPPAQVVTVPVTQTYESHAPQNFTIYGGDLPSIEADAERRRLSAVGGR